jgi:hypothetical protein
MKKNPKNTITLKEALEMLKGKSDIQKMGLRIAAKRDGFKSKHIGIGREKYLIDTIKYKKWVKNTIDVIPEGFILVGKAAKELGITSSYVYVLIEKNKILTKIAGAGKGKIYVDFSSLKKILLNKNKRDNYSKKVYEPTNEELKEAVFYFKEYCIFLKTKKDWRKFLKAINTYNNSKNRRFK